MSRQVAHRIAVDVMGGDYGPPVMVPGALKALPHLGQDSRVVLVGDQHVIRRELRFAGARPGNVDIVHAPGNIRMDEAPAAAVRKRRDSSIVVACQMMRRGEVDSFVSAGSTGAVVAASLLIMGRLPGVARPGIATLCPTRRGLALIIDVGANSDSKPRHVVQFAAMGRIYAERILGLERATVGLLNIGEEEGKGNELAQEAFRQLREVEPNFIGNVEGRDIFEGKAQVVVCDGFVGNILLKVVEGFMVFITGMIRHDIDRSLRSRVGGLLLRPVLRRAFERFDYRKYGGAPLLGCRGISIICHGKSDEEAVSSAVLRAEQASRERLGERICEELEREGIAVKGGGELARSNDTPTKKETPR